MKNRTKRCSTIPGQLSPKPKELREDEIKSAKDESSEMLAAEIKSVKDELSESIKNVDSKLTATKRTTDEKLAEYNGKLETTSNEVAELWSLLNDDVLNEIKLINQKLAEAKSENSELKSRNRSLLFLSILWHSYLVLV